jgi:hypothetical protein
LNQVEEWRRGEGDRGEREREEEREGGGRRR